MSEDILHGCQEDAARGCPCAMCAAARRVTLARDECVRALRGDVPRRPDGTPMTVKEALRCAGLPTRRRGGLLVRPEQFEELRQAAAKHKQKGNP